MKTILFIACLLFLSCEKEKCHECIRRWTYASHVTDQQGKVLGDYHSYLGDVETFSVCGTDSDRENAERRINTLLREPADSGNIRVTNGAGICFCN